MSNSSLQPILAWLGCPAGGNPTQYVTEKAFRHHELDWRYLTLEVPPARLTDAVRGMRAMGFSGGNVGPPHKESIVPLLDRTTDAAALAGSVNLILRDEGGLVGENTEGKAALEAIRQHLDPKEKRVALLGAGRMARAIAVELALAGAGPITILNRSATGAGLLAGVLVDRLQAAAGVAAWGEPLSTLSETDILVHATSLAEGKPEVELPLDLTGLSGRTLVVDTTIDPPDTRLLHFAADRGCPTIGGLEILSRLAALDVKLWTGLEPDLAVLREALEEFLEL